MTVRQFDVLREVESLAIVLARRPPPPLPPAERKNRGEAHRLKGVP